MNSSEVGQVLDALDAAGVRHWISGGWGVDALAGLETRPHRDLDIAVDAAHLEACMGALAALGYEIATDWLPLRVEVAASDRRWVDVHPVVFGTEGLGVQGDPDGEHFDYPPEAFTRGTIAGRPVPCLSIAQQRAFHSGYRHRPEDQHDLAVLDGLPLETSSTPGDT